MWSHSLVDLYFGHKLRAVCLGLIVNPGHPDQIYVALRVIYFLNRRHPDLFLLRSVCLSMKSRFDAFSWMHM